MAVKTEVFAFVGVMVLGAACVYAQEPPPAVPPPVPPAAAPQQAVPPAQPVDPSAAKADTPLAMPAQPVSPQRRREQIVLMEGMLAAAVRNGAEETARQIRAVQPGLPLFTGVAKARGFFLDNYGLFFHVEIPGVQPSVAWILEQLERERRVPQGAAPSRAGMTAPVAFDPNATYTAAVQQRLIDAMLDLRIDLQPNEWLTIAAHDGDTPRSPTEIPYESITLILRVKGSDLSDLRAGRLTLVEARKRVEVREF